MSKHIVDNTRYIFRIMGVRKVSIRFSYLLFGFWNLFIHHPTANKTGRKVYQVYGKLSTAVTFMARRYASAVAGRPMRRPGVRVRLSVSPSVCHKPMFYKND